MRYRTKKQLNKWFRDNGFKGVTCYRNYDFEARTCDNSIGVADDILWDKTMYTSFISLVQELGLEYDTSVLVLVLLHEVGHLKTCDEFTEFDEVVYLTIQKIFSLVLGVTRNKLYGVINYLYQRLPQEKRATEWAVQYANENQGVLAELEKILAIR